MRRIGHGKSIGPRGLVVQQGRSRSRPFGVIGQWPERPAQVDSLGAAEHAEQERRAGYRQREAAAPCGGCGAAAGFPHVVGCPTQWG